MLTSYGKCLTGGFHSAVDVLFRVRRREECSFELGRLQINTSLQHSPKKLSEPHRIASLGGLVVGNWSFIEKEGEHRAHSINGYALGDRSAKDRRALFQLLIDLRMSPEMP